MTGRASPDKCATRTGPAFRSSRDFDTYTTFDIGPSPSFLRYLNGNPAIPLILLAL